MRTRHRIRVPDGERDNAEANLDRRNPSAEQVASTPSAPALAQLQSAAGNSAVGALLKRDAAKVQRCACGEATVTTEEPSSTVQRLGLLDDLGVVAGGLFGDFAEQVDQKAPATCAESPNWQPAKSIPADIRAAINKALCAMNKAQEELDHEEGTLKWTLDAGGTKVVDVSLAPEPSASYPC